MISQPKMRFSTQKNSLNYRNKVSMYQNSILHITPHLGGGVGKVLLNYLKNTHTDNNFTHRVICLDYANEKAVETSKSFDIVLSDNMHRHPGSILEQIQGADIVLIHWWNHPLLYDFLVRQTLPPSRIILWSHISGLHPPYVFTEKIINYPDKFVFTSPVSFEADVITHLSDEYKKSLRVIWSTGGVHHANAVKPRIHSGFNIGYIGTVDYCKIHPDFLDICRQIMIPEVTFYICGGPMEKVLKEQAEKLGIGNKCHFTGHVPDIIDYLSLFDVFGYPLAPYHYGTCEQALAEAMAAGVVPVVLANRTESHMIETGVTGIVAKDPQNYIEMVSHLFVNDGLRNLLGQNAKKYAMKHFSIEKMIQDWENLFDETLTRPKTIKQWKYPMKSATITPKDIFLESLGVHGEAFMTHVKAKTNNDLISSKNKIMKIAQTPSWQADTRGTAHHYNSFFKEDRYLSIWSQLMKPINN